MKELGPLGWGERQLPSIASAIETTKVGRVHEVQWATVGPVKTGSVLCLLQLRLVYFLIRYVLNDNRGHKKKERIISDYLLNTT